MSIVPPAASTAGAGSSAPAAATNAAAAAREPPPPSFPRIHHASSGVSSAVETESDCSDTEHSSAPIDARSFAKMRRELERERHKNSQLTSQLKRQTQLQGQLVRSCRPCLQRAFPIAYPG